MDVKDLRIVSALSERSVDGNKYAQSGTIQYNKNKPYHDVGSNSSVKVDTPNSRPCAVIGPDRVLPPYDPNDSYIKKASVEPWPYPDNTYYRPHEYVQKIVNYQNPSRNISPRQTFQENMQRIMVAPTYNATKINDEPTYHQLPDKNIPVSNNSKTSMSSDSKYCDVVPYTVIPTNNDSKSSGNAEMCLPNVNPNISKTAPHGWLSGSINAHPQKPYAPSEVYPYLEYPSCAGPRQGSIPRVHRTIEDPACMYPEPYCQESSLRFKPYPNMKERYHQSRYDYINNYSNPFHPPPFLPHKYDLQKPIPPHPFQGYPHFKYIDNRIAEPMLDGFQRPINQQSNYNVPYHNQVIHPGYGPMLSSCLPGKFPPFQPDSTGKQIPSNKLPYDNNNKIYVNYENARIKSFATSPDNFYPNETARIHPIKGQGIMPNYTPMVHTIPSHPYYKKENPLLKAYDYANHYKTINQSIHMSSPGFSHINQFSPNSLPISPTDSIASNDTMKTQGTTQEDCGYVSQSSTTSIRSVDSTNQRMNDYYRRFDHRYRPVIRTSPNITKSKVNAKNSGNVKEKKDIDVRQFLQMWNEGDEENINNRSNKESVQKTSIDKSYISKQHESVIGQEQLYVLGSVNVPNEELSKYQHIQKVSKLPENIKGYTNIDILNQFEKAIESSQNYLMSQKTVIGKQSTVVGPRPVSPLDVEAKISQSVIHKEVGCNFEIKPCSPKMLNVEIAAPIHSILTEREIEKVTNPLSTVINSTILSRVQENCNEFEMSNIPDKVLNDNKGISSCKMKNANFNMNSIDSIKNNYTVQDLESNLGVCLASLPRLDNDIELNFPEVNQQFINANKGEAAVSTSIKDLPDLDVLVQTDKNIHIETISVQNKLIEEYPNKNATEKEFKKLSQYRKNKLNDFENKDIKLNPMHLRTDSVIIKNPENTKSLDKFIYEDQETPINLSSQIEVKSFNESVTNEDKTLIKNIDEKYLVSEAAVDFTLNKTNHKYFNCYGSVLDSKPLMNSSPLNMLKCNSESKDQSLFMNCEDIDFSVKNYVSTNCTNVFEVTKPKSMIDLSTTEVSIPNLSNKNVKVSKKDDNISKLNEMQESIPDNAEVEVKDNYIIMNNIICSPVADNLICGLQNECVMKYDSQEQIPSNGLNDECMSEDSVTQFIDDKKIIEVSLLENSTEINHTSSTQIIIDKSILSEPIIIQNKIEEIENSGTQAELKNYDFTEFKCDIDIKTESELIQNNEQLNFELVSSMTEENMLYSQSEIANKAEHEVSHTDLLITKPYPNNDSNKICKVNGNETSSEIINSPSRNFESPYSENVIPDFNFYNSALSVDNKVRIKMTRCKNKLGYVTKKLYSPLIQKLLIQSEGPCIPLIATNTISTCNEVIENHNMPINIDNVDNNIVTCKGDKDENLDNFNGDTGNYDFNYEINKTNVGLHNEAGSDSMNVEAKESDEVSINVVRTDSHTDKIIIAQDCLDINCKQYENVPKLERKSETNTQNSSTEIIHHEIIPMIMENNEIPLETKTNSEEIFIETQLNDVCMIDRKSENEDNFLQSTTDIQCLLTETEHLGSISTINRATDNEEIFHEFEINSQDSSSKRELDSLLAIHRENEENFMEYGTVKHNLLSKDNLEIVLKVNKERENKKLLFESEIVTCNLSLENSNLQSIPTINRICENGKILECITDMQESVSKGNTLENETMNKKNKENRLFMESETNIEDSSSEKNNIESIDIINSGNKEIFLESETVSRDLSSENENLESIPLINRISENEEFFSKSETDRLDSSTEKNNLESIPTVNSRSENEIFPEFESVTQDSSENKSFEKLATINRKNEKDVLSESGTDNQVMSKEDNFLDLVTDTRDLPLQDDHLVLTEINFDETEVMSTEYGIRQDDSINNLNTDNLQINISHLLNKPRSSLKRSLSDSAINHLHNGFQEERDNNNMLFKLPFKRKKTNCIENPDESNLIAQKLCNILQNRRNSISSIYNDENVSFCILIDDNCIITEEDEEADKISYTGYSGDCLGINNELINEEDTPDFEKEGIPCFEEKSCDYPESLEESWVQDVACVETVVSDDIEEDMIISAPSSPKNANLSDNEESVIYSSDLRDHAEKVKYIYGEKMCSDDAHFVETLYNTPQMNVNKTLITREANVVEQCNKLYDTDTLEKILSESNSESGTSAMLENSDSLFPLHELLSHKTPNDKEIMNINDRRSPQHTIENNKKADTCIINLKTIETTQDDTVNSCDSNNGNISSYETKDDTINYVTSRSPEVSSTTTEDKSASILLKITNYKGSMTSQINEISINTNRSCCKFTEKNDYNIHANAMVRSARPLITKGAQKYIPPLKETIRDLKVKLPLPQKSLLKLKQLKLSKDKPKVNKFNENIPVIPKKSKPKFEDVLRSIDEIQCKMHKQKNKRSKKTIPKVVIKKNENGSHYASTSNEDSYNPDLTGRKWQPWVFLEKNNFIDKMAIKKKKLAVFSYRKNTYVLAEKFCKYKSVNSTKFFISQKKINASSTGHLKYTIRLKHSY